MGLGTLLFCGGICCDCVFSTVLGVYGITVIHGYDNSDNYRRVFVNFRPTTTTYYQHCTRDSNSSQTRRCKFPTISPKHYSQNSVNRRIYKATGNSSPYCRYPPPNFTLTSSDTIYAYSNKGVISSSHYFNKSGQDTTSRKDTA